MILLDLMCVVLAIGTGYLFHRVMKLEDSVVRESKRIDGDCEGRGHALREFVLDAVNPLVDRLAVLEDKAEVTVPKPPAPRSWRQRRIQAERGEQYMRENGSVK